MQRFFSALVLALCLLVPALASAQPPKKSGKLTGPQLEQLRLMEDTLAVLGYAVVNDSAEVNRFAACKTLIQKLVTALKTENSFSYPFSRLGTVSILAPPDSTFRIFTWQLFVNDSTYRHYGAIQMNRSALKLFPLVDRSFEIERPGQAELTADRWFGAVYYGLRKVEARTGDYYLLFGFDGHSFFEKSKLIEVLSFGSDGAPVFGKPVFQLPATGLRQGGIYHRHILEYASGQNIKCNWDESLGMIVFDHLIPIPSPFGNSDITLVSDGDYEGIKIGKNGQLEYVEKIFNQVSEEAPSFQPLEDGRKGKDMFGRKKKGQ